jgi:homocitrate synthase NifV
MVADRGIRQIRLVDTAGTCVPQQVGPWVEPLVEAFPDVAFYCHFHDDFGLASANALLALAAGARGVDVAVGGFANRAGHPALAEVAMALRLLYGVELPGLAYERLSALSRHVENIYGLMERATQPITGAITHAVQSGIRTELVGEARFIFDIIEPESVGAVLRRSFGVRSGLDGMQRILSQQAARLAEAGVSVTPDLAREAYAEVMKRWEERSDDVKPQLRDAIARYHALLERAELTEEDVVDLVLEHVVKSRDRLVAPERAR